MDFSGYEGAAVRAGFIRYIIDEPAEKSRSHDAPHIVFGRHAGGVRQPRVVTDKIQEEEGLSVVVSFYEAWPGVTEPFVFVFDFDVCAIVIDSGAKTGHYGLVYH